MFITVKVYNIVMFKVDGWEIRILWLSKWFSKDIWYTRVMD